MNINVPLVLQDKASSDCWIACLSMIFEYYGIPKTISQIKDEITVYENIWTYIPQLWTYLIKNWFAVEVVTLNPHLFTKNHSNLSQEKLTAYFDKIAKETPEKLRKSDLKNVEKQIKFFHQFLHQGWKITVKIPTIEDVKEEISSKRPLITLMTTNYLLGDNPWFNFHFNVITGIDDEKIYVNDPLPGNKGWKEAHPIYEYMYWVHASSFWDLDNGSFMKITKQKHA